MGAAGRDGHGHLARHARRDGVRADAATTLEAGPGGDDRRPPVRRAAWCCRSGLARSTTRLSATWASRPGSGERAAILDETLAILDGLWTGEPFGFQGEHYRFEPMTFLPRPVQRPRIPIWVVGVAAGERSLARAARWDGLVLQTSDPDESRDRRDRARVARARPQASAAPFEIVAQGTTPVDTTAAAADGPADRRCRRHVVDRGRLGDRHAGHAARPDRCRTAPGILSHMPRTTIDLATAHRARLPHRRRHRRRRGLDRRGLARGAGQPRRHRRAPWSWAPSGRTGATPTRTGTWARARRRSSSTAKAETGFTLLIADDELKPNQQKSLESVLGVKVLDRSGLILDIFAQHARTHEGRLQVELAQLEYQLPRLTRLWTHLSRTGAASAPGDPARASWRPTAGSSGPRSASSRSASRRSASSARPRPGRATGAWCPRSPSWATPMRASPRCSTRSPARSAAVAEDRLFATLDPTSRSVKLGDGQSAILTDTVGFIHKLPHQLVDAFRATLEEVTRADVLLEVVDASDRHAPEHRQTVQGVLDELGAGEKPRLVVYNKADLLVPAAADATTARRSWPDRCSSSAHTGFGLDALRLRLSTLLADLWEEVDVALPYTEGELLARVRERGTVEIDYRSHDVHITGKVVPSLAGELRAAAARAHPAPLAS